MLRVLDLAHQPVAIAGVRYAHQVWTDLVALAYGVTGSAFLREQVLTGIKMNSRRLRVLFPLCGLDVPEAVQEIANHLGEKAWIVQRGVAHPLAQRLISQQ